jgi:hypothetical protein
MEESAEESPRMQGAIVEIFPIATIFSLPAMLAECVVAAQSDFIRLGWTRFRFTPILFLQGLSQFLCQQKWDCPF